MNSDKEHFCINVYHGSRSQVVYPDISLSRDDIDFGAGFYLTRDENMAKKWACNKQTSFVNKYSLIFDDLKIYHFKADEEWLEYVVANRYLEKSTFDDRKYDVLIGPTADDKLFNILDMYADGLLPTDKAIDTINCMHYSEQIVIKKQSIADNYLHFNGAHELKGFEKQQYIEQFKRDRIEANKRTEELLRAIRRRT